MRLIYNSVGGGAYFLDHPVVEGELTLVVVHSLSVIVYRTAVMFVAVFE